MSICITICKYECYIYAIFHLCFILFFFHTIIKFLSIALHTYFKYHQITSTFINHKSMIIKQPQISLINNYTIELHVDALICKNHILIFGKWYWGDSSWRSSINKYILKENNQFRPQEQNFEDWIKFPNLYRNKGFNKSTYFKNS